MVLSDKYICFDKAYADENKHIPAPWFKKTLSLNNDVKRATITVCGLGFYELFLNEKCITKGRMCPYITNPDDIVFYDNYDITDLLISNENEFKFLLGNGMQNSIGGYVWDFEKASFRSSPKLAFAIEIEYCNGNTEIIEADETVLTSPSKIIFNDLRLGEIFDAEANDEEWRSAVTAESPKGEKTLSKIRPITYQKEILPIKIWRENDAYIYDFGINTAGICRLNIDARSGQKIILTYGETLLDGKFDISNITFDNVKEKYFQRDIYICRQGINQWIPIFTYHGFRYVKVEGISEEQATSKLLTYVVLNTDLKSKGSFSCDDETINVLHKMSLNSTKSNFHHFPTDCPHREKNGWTADAALSSSHTLLYFEPTANYKQWLIAIRRAQRKDGALPGIVPTAGWGFNWGNGPAWDSVIVELPYQIWQKRNDLSAFKECAENILKYIKYLETRLDEHGLLEIGLGDWCAPHNPYKAPLKLTDSIEAFDISSKATLMFDKIENSANAQYCKNFAERIRENIRTHLFDKNNCVFSGDCQTSQAMGIYYKIINECEKEKAINVLLEQIKSNDYHIDTGVLGGRVLFHVLAENSEIDTAIKILKNPTAPSYVQWINKGETALCESFAEKSWLDSHNHHFWGNISAFFLEQICGIKPCGDKIFIKPNLPSLMNSANGQFDSVFGTISVALTRQDSKVSAKISYPKNAPVEIVLQQGYCLVAEI